MGRISSTKPKTAKTARVPSTIEKTFIWVSRAMTLPRPSNEPLLIGPPDPVLLDRGGKRALLVLGIDEADEGGR
jgi:hypothetical protein